MTDEEAQGPGEPAAEGAGRAARAVERGWEVSGKVDIEAALRLSKRIEAKGLMLRTNEEIQLARAVIELAKENERLNKIVKGNEKDCSW